MIPPTPDRQYKAMSKKEICNAAGVTPEVFRKWLRQPSVMEDFKKMGVKKTAHMLPPVAVKYVDENYGIY